VINGAGTVFDIGTFDDEDLDYSVKLRVGQSSKMSISYDVKRVDD
jgi:hypothetical protein